MEDEIIDYIQEYLMSYYSHLMTKEESIAFRHLNVLYSWQNLPEDSSLIKKSKEIGWISSDPYVLELVKNGRDAFLKNTATRIFNDNSGNVFINSCPKCGKPARTPLAKQCRHCYHKWHNE